MSSFKNSRKDQFLARFPPPSIEADDDRLTIGCKFNFSYFDVQPAGQSFADWNHGELVALLEKLKEYCKKSLQNWTTTPIGRGSGNVLEIYGAFPGRSDFTCPKHVPHQARWSRFRLESAVRLVGFVVPTEFRNMKHQTTGHPFDCNTFYVVFLDKNHRFYKCGEPK
jgi:hypothetical protein